MFSEKYFTSLNKFIQSIGSEPKLLTFLSLEIPIFTSLQAIGKSRGLSYRSTSGIFVLSFSSLRLHCHPLHFFFLKFSKIILNFWGLVCQIFSASVSLNSLLSFFLSRLYYLCGVKQPIHLTFSLLKVSSK